MDEVERLSLQFANDAEIGEAALAEVLVTHYGVSNAFAMETIKHIREQSIRHALYTPLNEQQKEEMRRYDNSLNGGKYPYQYQERDIDLGRD